MQQLAREERAQRTLARAVRAKRARRPKVVRVANGGMQAPCGKRRSRCRRRGCCKIAGRATCSTSTGSTSSASPPRSPQLGPGEAELTNMEKMTRVHLGIFIAIFACRLKRRDIGFQRSSEVACGLEMGIADRSSQQDQHSLCQLDAHRSMEVAETEWIEVLLAFAQHLQQVGTWSRVLDVLVLWTCCVDNVRPSRHTGWAPGGDTNYRESCSLLVASTVARSNASETAEVSSQVASPTKHDGLHRSQRGATGRGA